MSALSFLEDFEGEVTPEDYNKVRESVKEALLEKLCVASKSFLLSLITTCDARLVAAFELDIAELAITAIEKTAKELSDGAVKD